MIERTVSVSCYRHERTGRYYVGSFQLTKAEAHERHGRTYPRESSGCAYEWRCACPEHVSYR